MADLEAASAPSQLDAPTYQLHPLTGDRQGFWSIRVSANWRIVFRVEGSNVHDVDLIDYH